MAWVTWFIYPVSLCLFIPTGGLRMLRLWLPALFLLRVGRGGMGQDLAKPDWTFLVYVSQRLCGDEGADRASEVHGWGGLG